MTFVAAIVRCSSTCSIGEMKTKTRGVFLGQIDEAEEEGSSPSFTRFSQQNEFVVNKEATVEKNSGRRRLSSRTVGL
jgi:hypothetical protein